MKLFLRGRVDLAGLEWIEVVRFQMVPMRNGDSELAGCPGCLPA